MKSNRQFRKSRNQFFKRGFHRTYTMFLPKMLRSFFLQVTMSDTLNISSFLLFCYCFFICVAHVLRVRLVISVHPPPMGRSKLVSSNHQEMFENRGDSVDTPSQQNILLTSSLPPPPPEGYYGAGVDAFSTSPQVDPV